jgi:hypothetical protein
MASPIHDPVFRRQFIGFTVFLLFLGLATQAGTWRPVGRDRLPGTYETRHNRFMTADSMPEKLILRSDGTMEVFALNGDRMYAGKWRWAEQQLVLRTDAPEWDRQVRVRKTLLGPRLAMRIFRTPFNEDLEERDDEVDLVRTGPPEPVLTATSNAPAP